MKTIVLFHSVCGNTYLLARFYADDMNANGYFASYGTPANEISKHVAISAGFEMFSRQYLTKWTSTK